MYRIGQVFRRARRKMRMAEAARGDTAACVAAPRYSPHRYTQYILCTHTRSTIHSSHLFSCRYVPTRLKIIYTVFPISRVPINTLPFLHRGIKGPVSLRNSPNSKVVRLHKLDGHILATII